MSKLDYRPYLPEPGRSRIAGETARAHTDARMEGKRPRELFGAWARLFAQPFRGITTDGTPIPGLFELRPEGAPTHAAVNAAGAFLDRLSRE